MEIYDFLGNRLWTVVIPSQPPIKFGLSPFYPIPPVGGEFLLNFSAIFEEEEYLGRINYLIENGGLTVEEIDQKTVILHHGALPGVAAPNASLYMNEYYKYWYCHEEYSPFNEFPDPEVGVRELVIKGDMEIRFMVPKLYPVPLSGGKFEINYAKVLGPKDLNYVNKLTEKLPLYCYKDSTDKITLKPGPPPDIKPDFSQSEQNKHYAFYWTRNPEFAPDYWLNKPFILTYPDEPDIRLEIPGGQRIFLPGLKRQIDWKRFLSPQDWQRIKEELDEDGRYADEWINTKTIIHDRYAFNPDLWF